MNRIASLSSQRVLAFSVAALLAWSANISGSWAEPDGQFTRTFPAHVLSEIEMANLGTGIYDASAPENGVCPISILGLRAVVAEGLYYQSDREAVNAYLGEDLVAGLGNLGPVFNPCPFPAPFGKPGVYSLFVEDATAAGPYSAVSIGQDVCTQATFKSCIVLPNTGLAVLGLCRSVDAGFEAVNDGKGILPTGLSRNIGCDADWQNVAEYYNGTGIGDCDSWFFDGPAWGTDFCLIEVADVSPVWDGFDDTGYLTTCMSISYFFIDEATVPPTIGTSNATSHDYLLILDLDAPDNWSLAKAKHWDLLQGWNDLGGNTACPVKQAPAKDVHKLRREFWVQCMKDKGWTELELKRGLFNPFDWLFMTLDSLECHRKAMEKYPDPE